MVRTLDFFLCLHSLSVHKLSSFLEGISLRRGPLELAAFAAQKIKTTSNWKNTSCDPVRTNRANIELQVLEGKKSGTPLCFRGLLCRTIWCFVEKSLPFVCIEEETTKNQVQTKVVLGVFEADGRALAFGSRQGFPFENERLEGREGWLRGNKVWRNMREA